jgi:hypothetical protein
MSRKAHRPKLLIQLLIYSEFDATAAVAQSTCHYSPMNPAFSLIGESRFQSARGSVL